MEKDQELLKTLGDFTSRENWDKFFVLRGSRQPFEWYVDWSNLQQLLLHHLLPPNNNNNNNGNNNSSNINEDDMQILVPGCGNSQVSEKLYDTGFHNITNIDFSKVVISEMLRQHIRCRPEMRWRVMDMTHLQFADGSFDVVLDKGGLDALMEPEFGPKLGNQYLLEVKRVLKSRGKYICLTLGESHVLGLLFSKFRMGWQVNVYVIPHKPCSKPSFHTFLLVVTRENSSVPNPVVTSFDLFALDGDENQVLGFQKAIETENKIRGECSSAAGIFCSLEDLQLGSSGDLKQLIPGRRLLITLGHSIASGFSYKSIILDSKQHFEPFLYHCGVFLVPKSRAHEWLFSSEEGQWLVVESAKSARLIMVILDSQHSHVSMDDIQKDLSLLVKDLTLGEANNGAQIPFMMANDGVKHRKIIQQVTSTTTGLITVEDVVYEAKVIDGQNHDRPTDLMFRRLSFERSLGLIQSEALLTREESSQKDLSERGRKKTNSFSKSKKKASQRRNDTRLLQVDESKSDLKVDHSYIASSYHIGIIAGFTLVASNLENVVSSGRMVKTAVIGLGAGLLPLFLHEHMPFLDIEVVELDPVVFELARDYFGFKEDKQLKVHIADGVQFVEEIAHSLEALKENLPFPNGGCTKSGGLTKTKERDGIQILIIDADSADLSTGLTCPPANFTEESFLVSVKESLSDGGLFIINLVSRSPAIREMVVSRIKTVFSHLFCLEIEEDVNEVLFALPSSKACLTTEDDQFSEAAIHQLEKLSNKLNQLVGGSSIREIASKIICLK